MNSLNKLGVMVLTVAGLAVIAAAQNTPTVVTMSTSKFATPADSPACLSTAVQRGDPKTGPSVTLSKYTSGCVIPWHWHTTNESIVVVSGSGKIEMKDQPAQNLTAGDYFYMPSKHAHQFTCTSACTLSLTSENARDIHYIDKDGNEIPSERALRLPAKPMK